MSDVKASTPSLQPTFDQKAPFTEEELAADAQALIEEFGLPTYTDATQPTLEEAAANKLKLPLCLPQIATDDDSPFSRAYHDLLSSKAIKQEDLLKFLDGLNIAYVASPPLRVVDTVGMALGFVPHWYFQVASVVVQVGAGVSIYATSKTLTDRYLRKANNDYFHPRGLSVRICSTAAMRRLVGLQTEKPTARDKVNQVGRFIGNVLMYLPLPFTKRIIMAVSDKAPKIDPRQVKDQSARRVNSLNETGRGEFVLAPLNFDVPAPKPPSDNIMQKVHGYAVKLNQWKANRSNDNTNYKREQVRRKKSGEAPLPPRNALDYLQIKRDNLRTMRGLPSKMAFDVKVADFKEHRATNMINWIIIMNKEDDDKIKDIEKADAASNTEEISEKELDEAEANHKVNQEVEEIEIEEAAIVEAMDASEKKGKDKK